MAGVKGQTWKTLRAPKRRKFSIAIRQDVYELIEKDAKKLNVTTSRFIEDVMYIYYVKKGKVN